jgi:Zn-dependent peptidase ImmA (M78 family)
MTAARQFRPPVPVAAGARPEYDPWRDLLENWPRIQVVIVPMAGDLLGELHRSTIALRAGTSAAQRRCTLAHELVHLERGVRDCGRWASREEQMVHAEAARRLLPAASLARAIGDIGSSYHLGALSEALDVDTETLRVRLLRLTDSERVAIEARLNSEIAAA